MLAFGVGAREARAQIPREPGAVRLVTWNIGANSVNPARLPALDVTAGNRPGSFARVMRALEPDVVCLQEFSRGAARAAALFDVLLPLPDGAHWQAANALGNVLLSRAPLRDVARREFRFGRSRRAQVVATVRMPPTSVRVACTHLQSGGGASNIAARTRHAATIAALHPAIVLGDLNAIDSVAPYLDTLFAASLSDPIPVHNAFMQPAGTEAAAGAGPVRATSSGQRYTWRDDRQRFLPGRLDRILLDSARVALLQAWVLDASTLPPHLLAAFGMKAHDTTRDPALGWQDHLPVVADVRAR